MSILYELKNIEHYYDGKKVLNIENLILYKNQIVGFFGPNGSGKSSILHALAGVYMPEKDFPGEDNKLGDFFPREGANKSLI